MQPQALGGNIASVDGLGMLHSQTGENNATGRLTLPVTSSTIARVAATSVNSVSGVTTLSPSVPSVVVALPSVLLA